MAWQEGPCLTTVRKRVDWSQRAVAVALSRNEIENAPEWDGKVPVDPSYDANLQSHYRRTTYLV